MGDTECGMFPRQIADVVRCRLWQLVHWMARSCGVGTRRTHCTQPGEVPDRTTYLQNCASTKLGRLLCRQLGTLGRTSTRPYSSRTRGVAMALRSTHDGELRDLLLDTAYYAQIQQAYAAAQPSRKQASKQFHPALPASVKRVVTALIADRTLEAQLMHDSASAGATRTHTEQLGEMHTAFSQVLLSAHNSRVKGAQAASFVPICSVDWDNTQLRWGRAGVALCSSKGACEAMKLTLNQGPLPAFLLPGQPASTGSMCLLCTRLHAQMLNDAMAMIDAGARAPILMPPCTNLVNCFGGYHAWSLGVTPDTQRIFDRQCSIVGASALLTVRYSPKDAVWWVDQGPLVWAPPAAAAPHFRGGAQETRSCL